MNSVKNHKWTFVSCVNVLLFMKKHHYLIPYLFISTKIRSFVSLSLPGDNFDWYFGWRERKLEFKQILNDSLIIIISSLLVFDIYWLTNGPSKPIENRKSTLDLCVWWKSLFFAIQWILFNCSTWNAFNKWCWTAEWNVLLWNSQNCNLLSDKFNDFSISIGLNE